MSFSVTSGLDKGIIRETGKYRYIHTSKRIGAGGIQQFRLEAMKKGKATLLFEYKRPWEKETRAVKTIKVRVIVT